ncbi:riboflavin synthase [Candidatus Kaiserbacteria bacterium]|nr:riboflavin synthase [Candidatus Kaiserbacteria bacterium]
MFTGIVEKTAKIDSVKTHGSCLRVCIKKPNGWNLSRGQSVSIDGICSTVVTFRRNTFLVEYIPETLSKTTAGFFAKGGMVNLERSLVYGNRVEGHLMQGHVDVRTRIIGVVEKGNSRELIIAVPPVQRRSIALRGSVAINGASLTIARKRGATIVVALIPHTIRRTNLGLLTVGDQVNVELDHTVRLLRAATRARVGRNAAKRIYKKARRA